MDNSDVPKLFVRAEMYVQKNINDLDPTYAATLQGYDINIDGKTVDKKEAVNIVVDAYTPDGETNQEYISILAQLGYASGVKDGERNDAIKKGVEVLRSFNDSEAQIFASQPRP